MARATPGLSEDTAPQAACQEDIPNRFLYPTTSPPHPDLPPEGEGSGAEAVSQRAAKHLTAPKRLATGSVLCYACLERPGLADNCCISGATQMLTPNPQTCSAFIHRMLPGDHFFLHSAQELLLRALTQDLAQDMNPPDI
jgi:hypothetical protein